ncbi:hypothetical protein PT285_07805 [Lactobacillus sp. ESL0791]|nr:hypothetical protein [Lactobacillus sp. ESL0791]MDF7639304.1 hypothetical protein [Lactobacillus sp. ESL0791]
MLTQGLDNPWLNGEYDKIDFQSELADVGNYANDKAVGKEKVEW